MSLIHLARQGFITKSALPNVTRQRGTTTGTANLMLFGAGKDHSIGTNTTFTDSSTNNFTVTRNGDTIQATNNPFTGSVYFDGNGDYLTTPNNAAFTFGTGDFTIEFWARYGSYGANGGNFISNTSDSLNIYYSNTGKLGYWNATVATDSSQTIPLNTWFHCAAVRSGTTLKLYYNGTQVLSVTESRNLTADNIVIGRNGSAGTYYLDGFMTNIRVVKGTAVYTANFTVPTSPLTAITNTQLLLLTAQQAPFRDSSSNNFTVTANGNAAGSGLEPFPVNYAGSGYFDGTGDYLSVANSTNLDLPADFTVEAWIYLTSTANNQNTIIGKWDTNSYAWLLNANPSTGALGFSIGNSGAYVTGINFGTSITANTWHHVAVIRTGSTIRAFVNGTQVGSDQTNTSNLTATATTFIGKDDSALRNFNGYISNVRVIKGTAQYTAAFTPPAAPLTAVTNTQLLLLTNNVGPFVDTSANGFPVLRNGDTVQTGFSPFTGQPSAGSGYFDGNGDYLSVANNTAFDLGTGNFTIEMFVYIAGNAAQNSTGNRDVTLFSTYPSSGVITGYSVFILGNTTTTGTAIAFESAVSGSFYPISIATNVSQNAWHHVAFVRSGTTTTIYFNGVSVTSGVLGNQNVNTGGNSIKVGRMGYTGYTNELNGYITNLRVVKGTALYTSNFTPATAPLPAVPNTSLLLNTDNYTIANSTPTYLPVTVAGNTTISTAQYPTGMNRSIYFDGNGDYLQVPDNTAFAFGTGDFTVECFMWLDSTASPGRIDNNKTVTILSTGNSSTNESSFAILGNTTTAGTGFEFFQYATPFNIAFTVAVSIPTNTWNHIAYVRSGSNLYAFLNGVRYTLTTSLSASIGSSTAPKIGTANTTGYPNWFKGYLSNVRITKGSAIYTENFTAPTAPLSISVTIPNFVTNNIYGVYQLA